MTTYKIVRGFFNKSDKEIIKRGLTLEEAQEHCRDPETSSSTATTMDNYTSIHGQWFDGYDEE